MREIGFLLWGLYVTSMIIYSWFTQVSSFHEFLISLMVWFVLLLVPTIIFPYQQR
jgi:hypothetical protein